MITPVNAISRTQVYVQPKQKQAQQQQTLSPEQTNYISNNIAFQGLFWTSKKERQRRNIEANIAAEKARKEKEAQEALAKDNRRIEAEKAEYYNSYTKALKREAEYKTNLNSVITEQLQPQFTDLIIRQNRGKLTKMPNCVMITTPSKEVEDDLIKWTINNVECRVAEADANEDIMAPLEEAKKHFEEEGEWSVIHIKNFSDLVNPKRVSFEMIETLKDIMSATAEDYHATILFSSANPKELDDIALESHRVKWINANFKSAKEMTMDDTWERLDKVYFEECICFEKDGQCNYSYKDNDGYFSRTLDDYIRFKIQSGWNVSREKYINLDKFSKYAETFPANILKDLVYVMGLEDSDYNIDIDAPKSVVDAKASRLYKHILGMIKNSLVNFKIESIFVPDTDGKYLQPIRSTCQPKILFYADGYGISGYDPRLSDFEKLIRSIENHYNYPFYNECIVALKDIKAYVGNYESDIYDYFEPKFVEARKHDDMYCCESQGVAGRRNSALLKRRQVFESALHSLENFSINRKLLGVLYHVV